MDVGLLLIRLALGGVLAIQGASKLRREARAGTQAFLDANGFVPAGPLAWVTGITELGAGVLLAAGFLTPLAAAGIVGVLVNALVVARANGWSAAANGMEYPTSLLVSAAGMAFVGGGAISVDALLGWDDPTTLTAVGALALAVAAATPVLVARGVRLRRAAARAAAADDMALAA